MRSELFWDITLRRVATVYPRFGSNYRSTFKGQEAQKGMSADLINIAGEA
jgi:hypothetical protein